MDSKNNIQQDSENHLQNTVGRKNNFSVPASYFEELPSRTMERIHAKKRNAPAYLKPLFAASSLAVAATLLLFFFLPGKNTTEGEILLGESEISHMIENPELYGLSSDAIAECYLASTDDNSVIYEETSIPEEEVREYLEENAEIDHIINEY